MRILVSLLFMVLMAVVPVATASDSMAVSRQSDEIPERALRIVSLEAITTEMLLALGITPVGVGGLDAYQRQDKPLAERLDDSVDLGSDQQPNLERLVKLKPDLIIGTSSLHAGLFDRLDSLAPTLLYEVSLALPTEDAVAQGNVMLRHLGRLTGREQQAERVVSSLDNAIAEAREVARSKGVAGQPLAVLYPLPAQGLFIVSNENTLVVSLANRLGGYNPWPLREARNIHQRIEIHELAAEPDLHLLFIGGFKGSAMFDSPLWQALPVARNQRYGFLPTNYWSFGGPLTAEIIVGQMADVISDMGNR